MGDKTSFLPGTFYINCDAVDCCYGGEPLGRYPRRPDVKKWDINNPNLITGVKVEFKGFNDTTELANNPVKGAEHWHESDRLPLSKGLSVNYHHFITRNNADIISHRIDFDAPGAKGSILYGNFTVIHNVTGFREMFKIPDMCYPQGSGRAGGHALSCDAAKVEEWESKYFKHSHAVGSSKNQHVLV